MARTLRLTRLLPPLAALGLAASLGAQTAPDPSHAPATDTAVAAPADSAPKPAVTLKRERAISSGVAAQLAASMPKYTPPPPKPPPVPEDELPDLRDTDKPKNTIVRLPKMVIQDSRPPVFRDRDLNSKQGLARIAMRRYLTETDRVLNSFTIPLFSPFSTAGGTSNENRALAMYYEDERLKNMAEVSDNTNMVMKSDRAAGAQVKSAAQSTFMRWSDMTYGGNK